MKTNRQQFLSYTPHLLPSPLFKWACLELGLFRSRQERLSPFLFSDKQHSRGGGVQRGPTEETAKWFCSKTIQSRDSSQEPCFTLSSCSLFVFTSPSHLLQQSLNPPRRDCHYVKTQEDIHCFSYPESSNKLTLHSDNTNSSFALKW